MPELPPDSRCFHSATSSKFVYCFCVRMTPTGLPVQWMTPSFQLHVSGVAVDGREVLLAELAPAQARAIDECLGQ